MNRSATGLGRQLALEFARAPSGGTFLKRQYVAFPFHITRPFDDGEGLFVILQSLGAGLLQGDRFAAGIVAGEGAKVTIRTQGATIAHAMPTDDALQHVRLDAYPGSRLAWQPRPLVLFPGARVRTSLEVVVHDGADVMWCDAFLPHDAGDPGAHFTSLESETVVRADDGTLLVLDRVRTSGRDLACAGVAVHGTIGLVGGSAAAPGLAESLNEAVAHSGAYAGVSSLPGECGLLVRVLADDGAMLARTVENVVASVAQHPRSVL